MKRTSGLDLQGTGASKANIRASMVVASWLHLRFDIPGISLRVLAFSSGSSRSWCLGQGYQKVCPPMFYARDGNGIACLWLCLSELRQLPYFTDPIRQLLTDEILLLLSQAYGRASLCLPFYTVVLMSFSLNTSFTLSVLFGFSIIHHFFLFGKKPKSGPRVLRMPYYLISVV